MSDKRLFFSVVIILCNAIVSTNFLFASNSPEMLPKNVRAVLKHRGLPPSSLSAYVVNLDNNEVLLSWNPSEPRSPGSVMKLFTTASALDILGPTFQWNTEFYVNGLIEDQILNGDLIIKGYGDPYLTSENIWKMLKRLKQKGIKGITGDLLLDDSYFFHPNYDPSSFDKEPLRAYNVGPNSLMFNFKSVRFYIEADKENNNIRIIADPELDNIKIINKLKLVEGECEGYQRGIRLVVNKRYDRLSFRGTFPESCEDFSLYRSLLTHNEYTYGMFKSIWHQIGGEFTGKWKNTINSDKGEPFFINKSETLSFVISKINKHSNNSMSRNLLFTLAAEKYLSPANEEKGRKVVHEWLRQNNINTNGFYLDNGSGLSRNARLTAEQTVELLIYAYNSPFMPEFLSSLSLAGLDGTMLERFEDDLLTGKLHIKTGSIDHVNSIAGYLYSRSGKRYAFAVIQNYKNIHNGFGEELQEALLRWLYDEL
ncbi:MAG: D-alanyl-D-alanine carboxypeptidase/D-alanyl-D-alanine-endopeptidase [Pseudomonadota bacterium]|nr:D-alanyl-D-alanine carboxypeptidase/D-alanyl-D-alanine-endopeptidase [Pseudomonadota bacterium]